MPTDIRTLIETTALFKGLSSEYIEKICAITHLRSYKKNELIFVEGDPATGFYVVASGHVKIFKSSAEGKEQILHLYGPGNPFGEVPVFSGDCFPASAAATDTTVLLFIPRDAFMTLIGDNPCLAMNMLGILARRLREFTLQIENLALKEVPGRLAAFLTTHASSVAQSDAIQLSMTKNQLAALLGTIPETLSRIFSRMSEKKLISVDGRHITLLNRDALEQVARTGKIV
ncbi:MAG: transcriptional regulator [Deltaproteobacteria bacterium]|nr:MAG: transcriptional regulator [Deltaproteobacteria bacterium]